MLRRHLRDINVCYERELERTPELAGEVVVAFTINTDGTVSDVQVEHGSAPAPVATCATDTIRGLRWSPGAEADFVRFSYPMVFTRSY
jgi:TonB family protein